jgi:hypothetical protein
MGEPIEITRTELSAPALRALAGKTDDGTVVRRLLAIALVLEGRCRDEAASLNGMTRQTLRDWVHRYNAEGVEGLRSRTTTVSDRGADGRTEGVGASGTAPRTEPGGTLAVW